MVSALETSSAAIARLVASCLNVDPSDVSITKLTGDASTRSYYRARTSERTVIVAQYGSQFDERETAVERLARLEAENVSARLTFANDPCAHLEVTRLLLEAGLPVPRILAVSGSESAILIQDVGDVRLQEWIETRAEKEATKAYRRAVEMIVRVQDATETALEADSICSHLAFDEAKLRWELGFFFANYFNRYLHQRLEPAVASAVQADFKALCAELAKRPRVLAHRDYHARNLMMHSGEMFIIDHQDARMGPASYDLVSLVSDPYTTLAPDTIAELTDLFIEKKSVSRVPIPDLGAFRTEMELMTVQRMLKAVGTYASQAAQNNLAYVSYIRPAVNRAVAAMERLSRFDATRDLMTKSLEVPSADDGV
ncbi:MAG TPA: phosphotransferase [Blastocatellia bacterium]|nr:phosphotransferase [Blastocatellia bacterium]